MLCPKSAEHHPEHPQRSHADRRGGDAVSDRIITNHSPYEHKCTCAKCHVIECGMFRIWSAAFDNQNKNIQQCDKQQHTKDYRHWCQYAVGLHKFASEKVETVEGDIIRISCSGNITQAEFEPKIYRSKYSSWFDFDDSPYYNIHEELLLAYCGCYGVDSSDVELLLEYGYTCDEIEDMLADHDLLHEVLRDVKYMCGEDIYESCYGGAF